MRVVLIAVLASAGAFAQETTAGIQGSVKDASGGAVPNATVEVSSPALIGIRKVQTDEGGNFKITALPPGNYTLTAGASGFRTYKLSDIDLTVGRLPSIDVKLEVGGTTETVEVSGSAALVDATQSKVAVTVEHEVLDNLPKGRSFQTLIPFAPGARGEPLQGGVNNSTPGFQIDGASDGENVYMVDGVN
ncbi:MAG TPA: carboxypeptidase-like regulatory domain-containing protein, partial [Bryobacteraceae bacterium]|nr:carboxypeptidase-like regulatory domain-containing protein [Bryobacteraceae bacterium]